MIANDAMRIQNLWGVIIPYHDGNRADLDGFILHWEKFAEELVGEMQKNIRRKWA